MCVVPITKHYALTETGRERERAHWPQAFLFDALPSGKRIQTFASKESTESVIVFSISTLRENRDGFGTSSLQTPSCVCELNQLLTTPINSTGVVVLFH